MKIANLNMELAILESLAILETLVILQIQTQIAKSGDIYT